MRTLDLSRNSLSVAEEGALSGLKELEELDLSGNALVALPSGIFGGGGEQEEGEVRLLKNAALFLPFSLGTSREKFYFTCIFAISW